MCQIINLPQEIYKSITKYMNTGSILGLSRTCRKLFYIIRNDDSGIWRTLDYTQYPTSFSGHDYRIFMTFLSEILTSESRQTIKYIRLKVSYDYWITQSTFHTLDYKENNMAHLHSFVKSMCPKLISITFIMQRGNRPFDSLFTIGYNTNNPLFNQCSKPMKCNLYISKCGDCIRCVCNNSNSNFLCRFHEGQRRQLI